MWPRRILDSPFSDGQLKQPSTRQGMDVVQDPSALPRFLIQLETDVLQTRRVISH